MSFMKKKKKKEDGTPLNENDHSDEIQQQDMEQDVKEHESIIAEAGPETEPVQEKHDEDPEVTKTKELEIKADELQSKLNEMQDKFLRLNAEFDNYRKRTMREKSDLIKTAGEDIFINILPVVDDFERALKSLSETQDVEAVKEGIQLIYNKFKEFLSQRGLKQMDSIHHEFDAELHEALTKVPAPDENLKGKIIDEVAKGYYLYDKVIRYAKVVIGE